MASPPASADPPAGANTIPSLPFVALAAAVALAYVATLLAATEGHFVPQVTDLYLVCQYAKGMAEGHPFRYNPGDPPTTGATSPLHTALLALAHAVGIRGEGLVAFAVLAGAAFYLLTVALAARIGAHLAGRRGAILAGLLCTLSGPVAWGFLSGSDVGLAMLLATWLLERMVAGWERPQVWVAPAALLALARPEALAATLLLALAFVLGPGRSRKGRGGLLPWVPLAIAAAMLLFFRLLTGSWVGSSVADKSLLANYSLADTLSMVSEYLTDVARGVLLGFYPRPTPIGTPQGFAPYYFPPLALLLVVAAAALAPRERRAALGAWLGMAVLLFTLVAPNTFMGVHFNRYLMWAFPGLLALAGVGLHALVSHLVPFEAEKQRRLLAGAALVFVALGFLSVVRFAAVYADLAGEISRRDLSAARWIAQNVPRGTRMANLATSVEYLTGHYSMNLHGVTTSAFFGTRAAEREAGTFEALQRLPEAQRPPFLVTSVATQAALSTMRELVDGAPLFRTSSFGDEIEIYRLRYDLVGRGTRPHLARTAAAVQGLQLVDHLNVCDAVEEKAHGYRFTSHLGNLRLHGAAQIDAYPDGLRVIDGGRAILGGEAFEVATTPGRDLVVVVRTAAAVTTNVMRPQGAGNFALELPQSGMVVTAGGQPAGRFDFAPAPGWDEVVLRLPAALITGPRTRLELRGRYAAFYFWFYQ
jgi:hypothetical protein